MWGMVGGAGGNGAETDAWLNAAFASTLQDSGTPVHVGEGIRQELQIRTVALR
jgi:hypothetical protein